MNIPFLTKRFSGPIQIRPEQLFLALQGKTKRPEGTKPRAEQKATNAGNLPPAERKASL